MFNAETMLGYYCIVSAYFLHKDYASALKYLDVIKVLSVYWHHSHDERPI